MLVEKKRAHNSLRFASDCELNCQTIYVLIERLSLVGAAADEWWELLMGELFSVAPCVNTFEQFLNKTQQKRLKNRKEMLAGCSRPTEKMPNLQPKHIGM